MCVAFLLDIDLWTNRHDNELAEINAAAEVKHEVHALTRENERLRQVAERLHEASEMAAKAHLQTLSEAQESHWSEMDALKKAHEEEVQELKKSLHLAEQRLEICERGRAQELERWQREKSELMTTANQPTRKEDFGSALVQGGHRLGVEESGPSCRVCLLMSASYGSSSSPDDPAVGAKEADDVVLRALDAKVDELLRGKVGGREEAETAAQESTGFGADTTIPMQTPTTATPHPHETARSSYLGAATLGYLNAERGKDRLSDKQHPWEGKAEILLNVVAATLAYNGLSPQEVCYAV
jgi:hypothetical protein